MQLKDSGFLKYVWPLVTTKHLRCKYDLLLELITLIRTFPSHVNDI